MIFYQYWLLLILSATCICFHVFVCENEAIHPACLVGFFGIYQSSCSLALGSSDVHHQRRRSGRMCIYHIWLCEYITPAKHLPYSHVSHLNRTTRHFEISQIKFSTLMCHEEIEKGAVNLPFTTGRNVGCTIMLHIHEHYEYMFDDEWEIQDISCTYF